MSQPAMVTAGAVATDRGEPQELVERALAAAGGRGCAVLVEETFRVNLRWALNSLTTNGLSTGRSVTVIVAGGGGGVGVLSRQGIGPGEVASLVADAGTVADAASPAEDFAPFVGPGDDGDGAGDGAWDDPAGRTGPEVFRTVAEQLGDVFGRSIDQGRESFGFALHEVATTWLGTSAGLRLRHEQPRGTVELTGKSTARTRSTWIGRSTRTFDDVDVLTLDDEVSTRLQWQARHIDVPPGRYETVLPSSAVGDLLISYLWSSDARSAHEGRSAFARPGGGTRLGDRLSTAPITIRSDPFDPQQACAAHVLVTASSPMASVFDNGLGAGPATWLDEGIVAALPTSRHTAALSGLPLQPMAGNMLVSAGEAAGSVLDVVSRVERGLLLTCLWYIREVDPATLLLTGLTRDGVYVVENGEVVGSTTNFRFNESPIDMLARIAGAGAAEVTLCREWGEYFTRTTAPALRIADFNMSTTSPAS